ncbi:hypothetical protein TWF192_007015 [Orbilia oligospora]|uniref:GED domain-containing protein n=1 Tax=Orbilia oligospora TaxID=2813651 RepID=A0A6G1MMA0_ORBOL|nr:hypothetical protein TWF191_004808 [Orbilia oligospora]KAF3262341.1 hypothetical protein TWF192_007015 [Orbilia oligospora]
MVSTPLIKLSTEPSRSQGFLQKVAELRAQGVGEHISLPQLVVCGDQSAGKSSVLEGITGIPFPRNDGVCTKFATEITLSHSTSDKTEIKASIIPHNGRSADEKAKFDSHKWDLIDFNDLPNIISQVGIIMGIRGYGDIESGPAFGEDTLSIQVSGNTGLHLTVVDLPGLIAVANKEQTENDVKLVEALVDKYIKSPRTIIIAIVQATNDIANQRIIQKAQEVDTLGERTIGVITKPDLINRGTEKRIALLSRNEDTTRLKRGFFIVKSPAPEDLDNGDLSAAERRKLEADFFASPPWNEQHLDHSKVGTALLTTYLQNVLDEHIEKELPNVRDEIRKLLEDTEAKILALGPERGTISEMRTFLTTVSLKFHDLCNQSLDGNYARHGGSFFQDQENRVRSQIHISNNKFAREMRLNGAKWSSLMAFNETETEGDHPGLTSAKDGSNDTAKSWILETYRRTRGCELQGTHNAVLLAELFHQQSTPWLGIAQAHLLKVYQCIYNFSKKCLGDVLKDDQILRKMYPEVHDSLAKTLEEAKDELNRLWGDELRFPMTYNHYYSDNIQKARRDGLNDLITRTVKGITEAELGSRVKDRYIYEGSLQNSLRSAKIVVDMEAQACTEATESLRSYYKVAMKTFIDNVCRQVIERHIVTDLSKVLSPVNIPMFSDEKVMRLVSESEHSQKRRVELRELKAKLESGLMALM